MNLSELKPLRRLLEDHDCGDPEQARAFAEYVGWERVIAIEEMHECWHDYITHLLHTHERQVIQSEYA